MNSVGQWRISTVGAVLARIETGKSVKTQERPARDDEFGILRVSAVSWGEFNPRENKAILPGYDPGACPRPSKNDLLISRANTVELVGAAVLVDCDYPNLLLSDKILRLVPDAGLIEPRYLLRALRTSAARQHFAARAGGTSGSMQNISQEDIRSTPLPLPSLEKQRHLADILDRADAIRRKRNEAIALTEDLLRSTFLEMVGPRARDYHRWPLRTFETLAAGRPNSMRTGPFGSDLRHSEFVDEGVAVLGIDNAVQNRFVWGERRFITPDKYEKLKRYTVHPGDVIITIMGTTGRSAVVPDDIPLAITTKHLATVTLDRTQAEPEFLAQAIHTHPEVLAQIQQANRGAIMSGLNLGLIKSLTIRIPPINVQRLFSSATAHLRGLASRQRVVAEEADKLFASLVDRAFRGELTKPERPGKPAQLPLFE